MSYTIQVDSIRKSEKTLTKLYPNAMYIDVTSKAKDDFVKLSPFYPHGNIPVPFSENTTAKSVEGIWQGLKVFEKEDIDKSKFRNDTMKNLKRTVRKYGVPKGHRKGIAGTELLDYISARIEIYLPAYVWVLENKTQDLIQQLQEIKQSQEIVLLDYETNCDILDPRKPLAHAYLVKTYVENNYPNAEDLARKYKEIQIHN